MEVNSIRANKLLALVSNMLNKKDLKLSFLNSFDISAVAVYFYLMDTL